MNNNTQEFIMWVTGHDRETVEQLYANWSKQHSNYNEEYVTRKEFDAMAMVVKLHIKSIDELKKNKTQVEADFCGQCTYLSVTEEDQKDQLHYCKLFKKRVLHLNEHPLLHRLDECKIIGK